jgi:hypothetical protein
MTPEEVALSVADVIENPDAPFASPSATRSSP